MRHVALIIETSRAYGRGLLNGIAKFHSEHRSWWIHSKPYGLSEPVPSWFLKWRGDGILARIDNRQIAEEILRHDVPVIDLRNAYSDLDLPPFGASNAAVAEMAFEHLRTRGLRHFAFYGEPPKTYRYDDERRETFVRHVKQSGFECNVYEYADEAPEATNWDLRQERLGDWLRGLPKPIGVLGCHDGQGQEILDACRSQNLTVPDDVAVLGVDNDPYLCGLSIPPLSSIDLNTERIGYDAAAELEKMMSDPNYTRSETLFPPRYVATRQSTDLLSVDDADTAAAIRFIRDRACSGITVTDVIQEVAVSRSTLNRRFREQLGRSPKAEILRVQLEQARRLLIETELAVAAVAARSGFSEAKYFHEVFHRRVGMTPRDFRLSQQQSNDMQLEE